MADEPTEAGESAADELGLRRLRRSEIGPQTEAMRGRIHAKLVGEEAEPTRIGRYIVVERVGSGGMGVVYGARDPELDRPLAIKLLKPALAGKARQADHDSRLVREAQALAKLSHPNVVEVYDVGIDNGLVYIAMELIEGEALPRWLQREPPRPWREVLETFVAAGRGLAAAHAEGLVHRDFKPQNVLVGNDGRVRVVDFGLARPTVERSDSAEIATTPADTPVTRTGDIMGTPAYMAPERFAGAAADELSDQFSFCVSLFEGLYGRLPFAGNTPAQLVDAITHGRIVANDSSDRYPWWVRSAVLRGLRVDPRDRFPSMDTLLESLDRRRHRRARRWGLGIGAIVLGGLAVNALRPDPLRCTGAADLVEAAWSDAHRHAVTAAFEATGVPYADEALPRVQAGLDAYAADWVDHRIDACEDTRVRSVQSEQLLDRRVACLDRALMSLGALAGALAQIEAGGVPEALQQVARLPALGRCADRDHLTAQIAPPTSEELADRVQALRETLAQVEALGGIQQLEAAHELVERVVGEAEALGYRPLIAESHQRLGTIERRMGHHSDAIAAYERGFFEAQAAGHHEVAALTATQLIDVRGVIQRDFAAAWTWSRHAEAAVGHLGRGGHATIRLLEQQGALHAVQGNFDDALRAHLDALGAIEALPEATAGDRFGVLGEIGIDYDGLGELAEGVRYHRLSLEIGSAYFGPTHPKLFQALGNLAADYQELGEYEAALEYSRRALELVRGAYGSAHPDVAIAQLNYAVALGGMGDIDRAIEAFERSLAITTEVHGLDHPDVALALSNLGVLAAWQHRYEAAVQYQERALAIPSIRLGDDHPEVARLASNAGGALVRVGRISEARTLFERALRIYEARLGPRHPRLWLPLRGLGELFLLQGQNEEAIAVLERAAAVLDREDTDPDAVARVATLLANALWASGRSRRRAVELKRLAVQHLRAMPKDDEDLGLAIEQLAAWEAALANEKRGRRER